jgi:hypothetical protein
MNHAESRGIELGRFCGTGERACDIPSRINRPVDAVGHQLAGHTRAVPVSGQPLGEYILLGELTASRRKYALTSLGLPPKVRKPTPVEAASHSRIEPVLTQESPQTRGRDPTPRERIAARTAELRDCESAKGACGVPVARV